MSAAHGDHLVHAEVTAVSSALRRAARSRERGYFGSSAAPATSYAALLAQTDTSALALTAFATEAAQRGLAYALSLAPAPATIPVSAAVPNPIPDDLAPPTGPSLHHGRRLSHLAAGNSTPAAGLGLTMATPTAADMSLPPLLPLAMSSPSSGLEAIAQDDSETGLLASFVILKAQLRETGGVQSLPLPLLVAPFVKTIVSQRTSGAVTSAALQALDRLLLHGLIPAVGDGSHQAAVAEVAHAVTHCRFEAGDPVIDELVLLRILSLMRQLVCPAGGGVSPALSLPNEAVCEIVETALSMALQTRLSGTCPLNFPSFEVLTDRISQKYFAAPRTRHSAK